MTVMKVICDFCRGEGAVEISYFVDRKMDGAGSMENNYESIDLCPEHMAQLLNDLLHRKANLAASVDYLPLVRGYRKQHPTVKNQGSTWVD